MTATYDPSDIDPAAGDIVSAVRFLLQDTDTAAAEVQDEEIAALYLPLDEELTQQVRVFLVAARLAEALWVRYSRQASFSAEGISLELGKRAEMWRQTATYLASLVSYTQGGGPMLVVTPARPATF